MNPLSLVLAAPLMDERHFEFRLIESIEEYFTFDDAYVPAARFEGPECLISVLME